MEFENIGFDTSEESMCHHCGKVTFLNKDEYCKICAKLYENTNT